MADIIFVILQSDVVIFALDLKASPWKGLQWIAVSVILLLLGYREWRSVHRLGDRCGVIHTTSL